MDKELREFEKNSDEILKQLREFQHATLIAMKNGDFSLIKMLSKVLISSITSQRQLVLTIVAKYREKGDNYQAIKLAKNFTSLEETKRSIILQIENIENIK